MRLHLVIERHDIPVTRILWSTPNRTPGLSGQVSTSSSFTAGLSQGFSARKSSGATSFNTAATSFSTNTGYTIAHLLADVNEIVPLETRLDPSGSGSDGGEWGLEDYVVEFMGSECLHFMDVENLLREGDELIIRPLHYDELEIRHITGRHQIANDGTHLIDGVAFGKKFLKRSTSSRPPISIPPRNKRRRVDNEAWDSDGAVTRCLESAVSPPQPAEQQQEDDIISNEARKIQEKTNQPELDLIEARETRNSIEIDDLTLIREDIVPSGKVVDASDLESKISGPPSVTQDGEDSESVAGTEEPSVSSNATSESSGSEDESEDTSEPDTDTDSSELSEEDDSSASGSSSTSSSDLSSTSSSQASDVSVSDSDSEVSTTKPTEPLSKPESKSIVTPQQSRLVAPGNGSRKTKHDNMRARLRKRLRRMKAAGFLPKDANFNDLRLWDEKANESTSAVGEERAPHDSKSEFEDRRLKLLQDIEAGGVDVTPSPTKEDLQHQQAEACIESLKTKSEQSPKRKLRLDVDSSRRPIFGSLGKPTYKNKAKERSKAELGARLKSSETYQGKDSVITETEVEKGQAPQPVENWQDFIILKATECIYDEVEIPPPPFPFVQRWDAKSQQQIKKLRNAKNKMRKRKSFVHQDEETYNNYNYNPDADIVLNYDEPETTVPDVSVLETELQQQNNEYQAPPAAADVLVQSTPVDTEEDLPALGDVSSLPALNENDFKPGAIIAYRQLEVSKATGWQPTISQYRTAVIEKVLDGSIIELLLAKRDREQRLQTPSTGPRKYSGFEMPGYDDQQEEDNGVRELELNQLMETKLLRPAPIEDSNVAIVEESQESDLPDRIPESVPQISDQSVEHVQVSSPTRRDISQLIDDAGFRSAIDSDLNVTEDFLPFTVAQTTEEGRHSSSEVSLDEDPPIISPTFSGFQASPILSPSPGPSPDLSHLDLPEAIEAETDILPTKTSPSLPASSVQNSAQQVNTALSGPSMISDDGLHYITDLDNTGTGEQADESQFSKVDSPSHSEDPNCEAQVQQELQTSQAELLPSTVPPSVQENTEKPDNPSSASSVVSNPYSEVDRLLLGGTGKLLSFKKMVPSTAPARATEGSEPSKPVESRRRAFSSPRQKSPDPPPSEHDSQDDYFEQLFTKPITQSSQKVKAEPKSSQAPKPQSQIPPNTQVVDLTLSSDPVSPGNSDGEYAKSQRVPSGFGWVQKRRGRSIRNRGSVSKTSPGLKEFTRSVI